MNDIESTAAEPEAPARTPRSLRAISDELLWYGGRSIWRFAYRDPILRQRRFLNCTEERFAIAGIPLSDPAVVRRHTKTAEALCRRLQTVFLASAADARTETFLAAAPTTPLLSVAIRKFDDLYERVPSYKASLRAICDDFLRTVGDKAVDQITDEDLRRHELRLAKRVARTSVRSYLKQLGMLIQFCLRKGWIRADPRLTYRLPREELRDPNPFSPAEVDAYFEICRRPIDGHPKGWEHLAWIGCGMLFLGLRSIELIHARWEHVDLTERFMFVAKSHGAKEKQARQLQPIPLAAVPWFEAHRKPSGYVFAGYFGDQVSEGVLARARVSLQKRLPGFRWKRFRKTYATALARAGNDVVIVSRLLRHSAGGKGVSVAQRNYLGRNDRHLRDVVDEAFAGMLVAGCAAAVGPESSVALIAAAASVTLPSP